MIPVQIIYNLVTPYADLDLIKIEQRFNQFHLPHLALLLLLWSFVDLVAQLLVFANQVCVQSGLNSPLSCWCHQHMFHLHGSIYQWQTVLYIHRLNPFTQYRLNMGGPSPEVADSGSDKAPETSVPGPAGNWRTLGLTAVDGWMARWVSSRINHSTVIARAITQINILLSYSLKSKPLQIECMDQKLVP